MPIPDQVRDDRSDIQNILKSLDFGSLISVRDKLCRNDHKLIFGLVMNSSILNPNLFFGISLEKLPHYEFNGILVDMIIFPAVCK